MFNPEKVERRGNSVNAADYDLLLRQYHEAIDCIVGMVASNLDAAVVLSKSVLARDNQIQ
jgi:hypothetical protein